MNNVNLIGRLTKDIEIKTTSGNKAYCSFSIAVDAGKDQTYFIPCKAWEGRAENIAKYFHKGDRIGISGVLTTRTYEDEGKNKTIIEVLVNSFDFCSTKQKTEEQPQFSISTTPAIVPIEEERGNLPFEI